jgi:integrase
VRATLLTTYRNRMTLAGYRPRTIESRIGVLVAFASAVAPATLEEATREDAETFLSRPLAAQSRRAYRSHLRGFYGWLLEEGLIAEDPTLRIPPIRVPRAVPRPLSEDDLHLALEAADTRMRAWLLLMTLGGLRCIEVARLRPRDLLEVHGTVVLFLRECKGGGSASVPAHNLVVEALAQLPIVDGLWWHCNERTISKTVGAFLHGLGIDGTAHQLRHSAGSLWYATSGYDLLTTAALLRHHTVNSTQGYAQIDQRRPGEVARAVRLRAMRDPDSDGMAS